VLLHLIGGAHHDAMMMGFLLLGLAAWERSRKWLAVVLITLAVCIKLPAVIALAFLAWNWKGRDAATKDRLLAFPVIGAVAGAIIAVGCVLVGIGLGWITALGSTGKIYSTFAGFTKVGFVLSDMFNAVHLHNDPVMMATIFRLIGLAVAAALMVWALLRSPQWGVSKAVGFSLLALMLCSPVVWPWYLPTGFAVLAAVGVKRYRPTMIVLIISSSFLVFPTSVNAVDTLEPYQHWLGLLVILTIAACCVGAQVLARRFEDRARRGLPVPRIEDVLISPATVPAARAATATAANAGAARADAP
jgi:alpha-1,6-mannosyltransferase